MQQNDPHSFEIEIGQDCAPPSWPTLFGRTAPLVVEIGPGKGVFLRELAQSHPEWNILAIEMRRKRVDLCLGKLVRSQIENVRLIHAHAEEALPKLLNPASVRHWYINFPDPWPKRAHRRRRLMQPPFLDLITPLTALDGEVFAATDVHAYGDYILSLFESDARWTNLNEVSKWEESRCDGPSTPYEAKFIRMGRTIRYYRFSRSSSPSPLPQAGEG